MKRLVIAAPSSGTGKTSIALGLMRALKNKGLKVQPFKVGPDYIDPAFHGHAAGRVSRNLDLWMMEPECLKALFVRWAQMADISIIEGVMGLFDGMGHGLDNGSTAHLAKVLKAPVILVVDGRGVSTSLAAIVKGFETFDPEMKLAGVIINHVSSEKHYRLLKEAIEKYTSVQCLGYVLKNKGVELESRHLGLVPSVETPELDQKLEQLASMVTEGIDLEALLNCGVEDGLLTSNCDLEVLEKPLGKVRIGVARDEAFNFYYEDQLDLLRKLGAECVYFSPVHDKQLPPYLGGIYIGGGFPEVFAQELSQNKSMLNSIRQAHGLGIPIFAECGGYMYLMESIQNFENHQYPMVGIIEGYSQMTQRLQRFGYVTVQTEEPSILGPAGQCLKGHEFHRSIRQVGKENAESPAYGVIKGSDPSQKWRCGANKGNVLAAYAHVHWYSNIEAARNYIKACLEYAGK